MEHDADHVRRLVRLRCSINVFAAASQQGKFVAVNRARMSSCNDPTSVIVTASQVVSRLPYFQLKAPALVRTCTGCLSTDVHIAEVHTFWCLTHASTVPLRLRAIQQKGLTTNSFPVAEITLSVFPPTSLWSSAFSAMEHAWCASPVPKRCGAEGYQRCGGLVQNDAHHSAS